MLVDEVTRQVTSASIAYEDAGEHTVKGKAEPLRLWRAVRVVAGVGGSEREQGLEAPFVGRDGDLRLVKELFHGALERRCGPAGGGLRRGGHRQVAAAPGVLQLHRRAGRHGSVAFGAVPVAMARAWRTGRWRRWCASGCRDRRGGHPRRRPRRSSRSALDRWVPDAADREFLAPRLGALLGVAEPGLGREELFAGWRLFFERLADTRAGRAGVRGPAVGRRGAARVHRAAARLVGVEPDLHPHARPARARRRAGGVARRAARGHDADRSSRSTTPRCASCSTASSTGCPRRRRDRIVAQAEGVPLYAIETVRALADRGVLAERDGRLVLDGRARRARCSGEPQLAARRATGRARARASAAS